MTTVTPIQTSISALELRSKLGEIIDKAIYQGRTFIVKRAGKAAVAILPMSQYEALIEANGQPITIPSLVEQLHTQYPDMTMHELTALVTEALGDMDAGHDTVAVETLALMLNTEITDLIKHSQEEIAHGKKMPLADALL